MAKVDDDGITGFWGVDVHGLRWVTITALVDFNLRPSSLAAAVDMVERKAMG